MFEPVRAPNAVDQVIFGIEFARRLNPNEAGHLRSIQNALTKEFPRVEELKSTGVQFGPNGLTTQQEFGGFALSTEEQDCQHKIAPKRPDWQIRLTLESVFLHCLNYESWQLTLTKVSEFFSIILQELRSIQIESKAIVLQFNDLFVYQGQESEYQASQLFNQESRYFSRHVLEAGFLWHLHQGWFEYENSARRLNVLNISARKVDALEDSHQTLVEHVMRKDSVLALPELADNQLTAVFDECHLRNKEVIKDLLVDDMKQRIGL